jgi:hypothetical protein
MAASIAALSMVLVSALPAAAAPETAGAFAAKATGPLLTITPTPNASCAETSSGPLSVAQVGPLAGIQVNLLNAECTPTTAKASIASAMVLGINIGVVTSQCIDGQGSSNVASVNGLVIGSGPLTLNVGLAVVKLNETTTNSGGEVVQNAVHITTLGEDIILAQSRCSPPGPVVSEVGLAVALPLSAAMLFGAAYLVHRRRHGRASA